MRTKTLLSFILALFMAAQVCHAVAIISEVEPADLRVGEYGRYVVTVNGTSTKELVFELPEVDGLIILNQRSVSNKVNVINGSVSSHVQYSFPIRATRAGTFTIPEIRATLDGEKVVIPSTRVNANKDGSISNDSMIVKVEAPERMYLGQSAQAMLHLMVRSDLNIVGGASPLKVGSDGILQQPLDPKLARNSKVIVGTTSYLDVSIPMLISASKSGTQKLEYACEAQVRQPRRNSRVIGGLDDPLEEMMRNMTTMRMDDLSSPLVVISASGGTNIEVSPLPDAAPASFDGAIGSFSAKRTISDNQGKVGEPLELTLTIEGEGDLRQIMAPKLDGGDDWRGYPPTEQATHEDALGLKGNKVFKYLITPLRPGTLSVPPMRFCHFDPVNGRYVESVLEGERVEIEGSGIIAAAKPKAANTEQPQINKTDGLHSISLLYAKPPYGALLAPQKDKLFLFAQLLPAALLAWGIIVPLRRRMAEKDPMARMRRLRNKHAAAALHKALKSARANDAASFFAFARPCLRNALAVADPLRQPETVSAADVIRQLGETDAETRRTVNLLFNGQEALRFGPVNQPLDELARELSTISVKLGVK